MRILGQDGSALREGDDSDTNALGIQQNREKPAECIGTASLRRIRSVRMKRAFNTGSHSCTHRVAGLVHRQAYKECERDDR